MRNHTFLDLLEMPNEQMLELLIEDQINGFTSKIYLDYYNEGLVFDNYRYFSIDINDDLGLTQNLVLKKFDELLDIPYEVKLTDNFYKDYLTLELRVNNNHIIQLFKSHMKNKTKES